MTKYLSDETLNATEDHEHYDTEGTGMVLGDPLESVDLDSEVLRLEAITRWAQAAGDVLDEILADDDTAPLTMRSVVDVRRL